MINEIALEPAALSAEGRARAHILSDLRPHRGRILVVPSGFKTWANQTREAANRQGLKDRAKKLLFEKIKKLKENKEFLEVKANQTDDKNDWLQQIAQLGDRRVKAYVLRDESVAQAQAQAIPAECIVELDDYDRDAHPIAASSSAVLPRTNDALLEWSEKLLFLSNHLILIDRYFNFSSHRQRDLLNRLTRQLMQGRPAEKIEVHTYSEKSINFEWESFQRYARNAPSPKGLRLTVSHWSADAPEHDRYMFAGPQSAPIAVSVGGGFGPQDSGNHTVSYKKFEGSGMKTVYEKYTAGKPEGAQLSGKFTMIDGVAQRLK